MATTNEEIQTIVVDQQMAKVEQEINKVQQLLNIVAMNSTPLTSAQSPSGYHFADTSSIIHSDEYLSLNEEEEDQPSSDVESSHRRRNMMLLGNSAASELEGEEDDYDAMSLTVLSLEHRNQQLIEQIQSMEKQRAVTQSQFDVSFQFMD